MSEQLDQSAVQPSPVEMKKVWCGVCEASCGLEATVQDGRILKLRPDEDHPNSEGFACSKGILFPAVLDDPDRVREPLRRKPDGTFEPVSWEDALDDIGSRLRAVIDRHGREAVGVTFGNPAGWNYAGFLTAFGMGAALGSKHLYSSASTDINNYWVVGQLLYGNNMTTPIPDFARTHFALIIGANPLVSHGSMATLGNVRKSMLDVVERGGRIVVVDPRRTETAELFEHVAVRPDGDAHLLLGLLKVLVDERLVDRAALARQTTGAHILEELVADVDLDRAATEAGVPRTTIEQLARDLATAPSAFVYGRCGASLGRFSTLVKYLIDVLNICTGNLDRAGGMTFTEPFFDAERLMGLLRMNGYDRWRTRVDGIPEVMGTSPMVSLPREALTPGPGQLRAMIGFSSNMAMTSPASLEMGKALSSLDLFVSLDPYITDTSRLADYVLPPTLLYEREGFPLFGQFHYTVPNASWTERVATPPAGARDDWWIVDEICKRIGLVPSPAPGAQLLGRLGVRVPPHVAADVFIRVGRYGDLFGLRRRGVSRKKLLRAGRAVKLRDRVPTGTLRKKVHTKDHKVHLDHALFRTEVRRLLSTHTTDPEHPLRLFTIRELRSQNSWLHNVPKLMAGGRACRLRIHPDDAAARGLQDGGPAALTSKWGEIEVEVKITDEVMPGSVGLNHHWGHTGGWRVAVAAGGGRYNDLVPNEPALADVPSGNAWLNGIGVEVANARTVVTAPMEELVGS